jgi:hypothetical protein
LNRTGERKGAAAGIAAEDVVTVETGEQIRPALKRQQELNAALGVRVPVAPFELRTPTAPESTLKGCCFRIVPGFE